MNPFPLKPHPWQLNDWQQLTQLLSAQTLPHAMLFVGIEECAKRHFAEAFAQLLLCVSPVADTHLGLIPCKQCRSCQLNTATAHPDLFFLVPEEEGKAIKIDQVRELNGFLAQTSSQGGYKVVIIDPADAMNTNSANALLKTLEEPAAKTLMMLLTSRPSEVIPTIRSRCRLYKLAIPGADDIPVDEIQLAQKKEFIDQIRELSLRRISAVDLANKYHSGNVLELIDDWLSIIHILSLWNVDAELNPQASHATLDYVLLMKPDSALWRGLIHQHNLLFLHKYYEKLLIIKQQLLSGANPNKQLLLEEIWMDWQALLKTKKAVA